MAPDPSSLKTPELASDGSGYRDPGDKPYVAIFRLQLFKPSEGFIVAQAKKLERYEPIFVGLRSFGPAPSGAKVVCPKLSPAERMSFLTGGSKALARFMPVKPDIIHAHFAVDAVFAMALARYYDVPLVVTLHGFDVTTKISKWLRSGRPALIMAALLRTQLQRSAARFLAVSDAIRSVALQKGFPNERTRTAYLGIDVDRFPLTEPAPYPRVVHVGRLVEKKGTHYLICAFAAVSYANPDARLQIVGDGPLRVPLERLTEQLGLRNVVTFHGSVPHEEVIRLMANAAIVAVPSVTAENGDQEGLPTVALEAAALGRPVVGTRHSGIPEAIIDGKTGLIVQERDTGGLARALNSLLDDPERTRSMGAAGRAYVEQAHNAGILTKALEAQYDELIAMGPDHG